MKQKVSLTESEFRALIEEQISEALQDEGLWGGIKGMLGKGAKAAGNAVGNAAKNVGNAVSGAAKTVGNNVQKNFNAAKDAYQQGSMEQDKKNAFDKCVKYYQKNQALFAKVNKMKGQIKQMANKYGFTIQDVQNAVKGVN